MGDGVLLVDGELGAVVDKRVGARHRRNRGCPPRGVVTSGSPLTDVLVVTGLSLLQESGIATRERALIHEL